MPQTRVRTYRRNGQTVRSHRRRFEGKFRPSRALRHARRSSRDWGKQRYARASLFGAAATAEILGFFVFKSAGGLLIALGLFLGGLGLLVKGRT